MSAEFHNGDPLMVDHTPAAAVTAGDIVQIGTKTCVAHGDIGADELGALAWPGHGVYRVTLDTGRVLAEGDPVTVDLVLGDTSGVVAFGYAISAADQTAGDTVVEAVLDN